MKKLLIIICLINMFCISGAYAEQEESFQEKYGPVDLLKIVEKSLTESIPGFQGVTRGTWMEEIEEVDGFKHTPSMFKNMLGNEWIVTRSLVFGLSNAEAARQAIEDNMMDILVPTLQLQLYKAGQMTKEAALAAAKALAGERVEDYQSVLDGFKILVKVEEVLKTFSMYERGGLVAIFILFVALMVRLVYYAYSVMINTDRDSNFGGIQFLIHVMVVLVFILSAKHLAMFFMASSDLIRNTLMGSAEGVETISETVREVMRTSQSLYNPPESLLGTILEVFHKGVSFVVQGGISIIFSSVASLLVFVVVLMGDVMLGITFCIGPFVGALSLIPSMDGFLRQWFHSLVKFAMYAPIASIFLVVMSFLFAATPPTSVVQSIVLFGAFIFGAIKIPDMAESFSGSVFADTSARMTGKGFGGMGKIAKMSSRKALS